MQPVHIWGLDGFSCVRLADRTPQFNTITDFIGFPVFVPNSSIYLIVADINSLPHCAVKFERAAVIKFLVKRDAPHGTGSCLLLHFFIVPKTYR